MRLVAPSLSLIAVLVLASPPAQTASVTPRRLPHYCVVHKKPGNAFTYIRPPAHFKPGQAMLTGTVVTVTYVGFGSAPQAQAAFQQAVNIWKGLISSPVPIKVTAMWEPLPIGVLGSAGSVFIYQPDGGTPNTWYGDALADRVAGYDNGPYDPDIEASLNSSDPDWYFGTDGLTPPGKYDFVSVALHELTHGLEFSGSADVAAAEGFLGYGGDPAIYDRFTETDTGTDLLTFTNPSVALGTALQQPYSAMNPRGPGVYWNGAKGVLANAGQTARLYTPNPWAPGSSYSHLDEDTYPAGNPNSLMTYGLMAAEAIHNPGPVTLGMFTDMGWAQQPDLIKNGSFSSGTTFWFVFGNPPGAIDSNVTGGVFNYRRVAPAPGTTNQAVIFQETGVPLAASTPIAATFDLGNSSNARKRISVLILEADFSDLHVCTFFLAANAPMRTYMMRTHTTKAWVNASIYFYAATVGAAGQYHQLDNVSMHYEPGVSFQRTDCVDPTTPLAMGGASGANIVVNGTFNSGPAPWGTFGQIVFQTINLVFEFYRPAGTPAGVVLQATNTPMPINTLLRADFWLGNSSGVRKRVTVILHDLDFSDLAACTFWLRPGALLTTYSMSAFTTKPWTNATISVYPATVGTDQWIRLDNVTLRTYDTAIVGHECVEPGGEYFLIGAGGSTAARVINPPLRGPAPLFAPPLSTLRKP